MSHSTQYPLFSSAQHTLHRDVGSGSPDASVRPHTDAMRAAPRPDFALDGRPLAEIAAFFKARFGEGFDVVSLPTLWPGPSRGVVLPNHLVLIAESWDDLVCATAACWTPFGAFDAEAWIAWMRDKRVQGAS